MSSEQITASFLSLSIADESLLSPLLMKVAQHLGINIAIGKVSQANLLFINQDSAFTPFLLKKLEKRQHLIFFISQDPQESWQGHPCIQTNIAENEFITLLQKYLQNFGGTQPTEQLELDIQPGKPRSFASLTELAEYFTHLLGEEVGCRVQNDHETLYFDFKSQMFFVQSAKHNDFNKNNTSIKALIQHFTHGGQITIFSTKELKNHIRQLPPYILERFIWILGESITDKLLNKIPVDVSFGITHWPDFGILKTNPAYVRICAILMQKPLNIKGIIEHFHLKTEECIGFLNSCVLCQYLIWGEQTEQQSPSASHDIQLSLSLEEIQNCRLDLGLHTHD
ncbi:hypothetical protein [Neisseria sp. Ec49-e6-T10]|uniref:hypothetical protein n=1 Tax=Neisseria sp. Ec49-e6-T10 TaxID=3140744 RepID=UPI003EB8589C